MVKSTIHTRIHCASSTLGSRTIEGEFHFKF
jgi:hypothetical protein